MIRGIEERRSILRLENVMLMSDPSGRDESIDVDMHLFGGDVALINLERPRYGSMLVDTCCGLIQPSAGAVFFLGKDWTLLPADTANALRGRIGCAFVDGNWINRLTLLENILLPKLHHTRRSFDELRDDAVGLAEGFGLPGVPTTRPNDAMRADLQRAACVRAFLGQPSLILLEEPTYGVYPEMVPALINAIRKACDQGSAVIWLTLEEEIWRDEYIPASYRYRLTARKLMEVAR